MEGKLIAVCGFRNVEGNRSVEPRPNPRGIALVFPSETVDRFSGILKLITCLK